MRPGHNVSPAAALLGVALLFGCAAAPLNASLAQYRPDAGYRLDAVATGAAADDGLFVVLAFSGGGTRAAALSYGVLRALADTPITWNGRSERFLDEVDLISTVSGGSFTGAYYALFGDRIFQDFEPRFLKRDIQGELRAQLWNPLTLVRLASPYFDRIDLAAELYDATLFEQHRFADLAIPGRRPFLIINATHLALGDRFEFDQDQFDWIGSDLSDYPVARAVAASSAFPILLSSVALANYPEPPNYREPPWVENALEDYDLNRRRFVRAQHLRIYRDKQRHPFVHLLDGGLADNIGLRAVIDAVRDGALRERINRGQIQRLVVIVVNAKTEPPEHIDRRRRDPGLPLVALKTATIALENYSFETIELVRELAAARAQAERAVSDCQKVLADRCPAAAQLPALPHLAFDVIEVGFERIADPKERAEFLALPTSFRLEPAVVDRLVEKGGALLRADPEFQRLLRELR